MTIRPTLSSRRERPARANKSGASTGTVRGAPAGEDAKPSGPPTGKIEKPENGNRSRPPREKPEIREDSGKASNPALELINANPRVFAQRGSVGATWRDYQGHALGPYYRLRYWQQGQLRQLYLGREGPRVQAVRDRLAELHQAHARHKMDDPAIS
jgi:hypothetical protein